MEGKSQREKIAEIIEQIRIEQAIETATAHIDASKFELIMFDEFFRNFDY